MKNSLLILLLVASCALSMEPGKKRKSRDSEEQNQPQVESDKKQRAMKSEEKSVQQAQSFTILDTLLPSDLAKIVCGYLLLPESCKIITPRKELDGCQLSPCGQRLMIFHLVEKASVYEIATDREIKTIPYPDLVTVGEKHLHPDGSKLLLKGVNEKLMVQDVFTQVCKKFSTDYKALDAAKFSTTGKYVGACYQHTRGYEDDYTGYPIPRYFGIFDAASGALAASKEIGQSTNVDFVFNTDDSAVALGENGRYLVLVNSALQDERSIPADRHPHSIRPFCFSADNRYLLSGDADFILGSAGVREGNHRVSLWDVKSRMLVRTYPHPQPVKAAQCAPDNAWIATGCADGKMRFIEQSTGNILFEYAGINGFKRVIPSLNRIEMSKDGQVVAVCKNQYNALVFVNPIRYLQLNGSSSKK